MSRGMVGLEVVEDGERIEVAVFGFDGHTTSEEEGAKLEVGVVVMGGSERAGARVL